MRQGAVLPFAFTAAVLLFLTVPLVLCMLFAFTTGNASSLPVPGLGLRWFRALDANPQFWAALSVTAQVTVGCALASTLTGLLAAIGMTRMSTARAMSWLVVLSLPLMLPPLVLGLALLTFFTSVGLKPGVTATILAHLVFTLPFVTGVLYARLSTMDRAPVDAARDLGQSPFGAFRDVTLPALGPTLIGAMLIAMALSLDDFVITFFTTSRNTLSTLIWGMMRQSITPEINAIGTSIIAFSLSVTVIALRLTRYRG
ncbi:ABC transporter permease [Salipiger abyssi]|uniref:ABC transporter permease n=1 Tax=Salipiger abyssi TaxID=1250539 RepID=UPI001A8C32FA|nr:ABC transporter permease [Salipiger abyssi]MBN9887093.1 ABC transporter permease [Salipiger abyssi]